MTGIFFFKDFDEMMSESSLNAPLYFIESLQDIFGPTQED